MLLLLSDLFLRDTEDFSQCGIFYKMYCTDPSAEVAAVCWKLFLESAEGAAFVFVKLTWN